MKHLLVSPSNYPISAFNDLLNYWRNSMNNDSKSNQSIPADEYTRNTMEPFVEEAYAVHEYAYMYYLMTPFGSGQTSRKGFLD